MKQEEKALIEKVSSFYKAFAPTKILDVKLDPDLIIEDNDVDGFIRVVMCYKTDAPLFPVFIVDGGLTGLDMNKDILWFVPVTGVRARVKIDKKYLKDVKKNGD